MEHLKGTSLGYATALPKNIRLGWKGLPGDKHPSLMQKSVGYGRKKFYSTGPSSSCVGSLHDLTRSDQGAKVRTAAVAAAAVFAASALM